jgi:hypothetical protein
MKAHQGDRIILAARHTDEPTRQGEVLEVRARMVSRRTSSGPMDTPGSCTPDQDRSCGSRAST